MRSSHKNSNIYNNTRKQGRSERMNLVFYDQSTMMAITGDPGEDQSELRSCVKVEVDVLVSQSLIVRTVSGRKATLKSKTKLSW